MENGEPAIWTISWKEAIRREHEYQKKVKIQKQLAGNSAPPTTELKESEGTDPLNDISLTDDAHTSSQKLQCDVPPKQNSVTQSPPLATETKWGPCPALPSQLPKKRCVQQSHSQQNSQPFWEKRAVPSEKQLGLQKPMFRQYWCHVCMVDCTSEKNLMLHLHGQKHRLNMETFKSNKNSLLEKGCLWCHQCNIPCMDVRSLIQHRQGKKHQARMETLAKWKASRASAAFATSDK